MTENEFSKIIVNACYQIHTKIGPGLFESVYEEILDYEMRKEGLLVERQKSIPVIWEGLKMEQAFEQI